MGPHAAVVGRPDNRSGRAPVAYIVTTGAVSAQEIGEWVSPRLAPDKRPIEYHTVEQLPRPHPANCSAATFINQIPPTHDSRYVG